MNEYQKIIIEFNKNPSKEAYSEIFEKNFKNLPKCRVCNGVIYYYDSSFIFKRKGGFSLLNKSCLSSKTLDKEYRLSVCELCLSSKFPEYLSKNKSRVFNQMNYITEYAFNISEEKSLQWKKDKYAITENNLIKKYGNNLGKEKWIAYCNKQSLTNKFEYKRDKYGWDEIDFTNYNKYRSITIDSMVRKYGENIGLIKWESYIEKQKMTKSKDYYIKKYGIDFWINLCKSKSHTIDNYISRYKDIKIAESKLEEFWNKTKSSSCVSKSSQSYFNLLDKEISSRYTTYYFDKDGKEYGKNLGTRWVFLDYFIKELNLNIEYNGDLFHANPKIFGPDDEPIPFNKIKSKDIWKNDEEKIKLLEEKYNINTIVIWESELPNISELVNKIEIIESEKIRKN